ncbi:hypothetical protein TRAPUB_12798 [Trametes pubescens]|uniref:Uncharacterized protein n=1 Tax=Trametes pubescens TaxID=154538 RepID=A0A1M2VSY7_TRAPU|nr:hypothetical protein TRAPUB_12798 [Trametes pubescens]
MATRRRVGFSTSTSEASRRQLMQPVPCWEKVWGPPDGAAPGSTLKVYKWVRTDKKQQFSDDEGEVDQPLAPIQPEEIEVVDGDDDMDQDEAAGSTAPDMTPGLMSRDVSEPAPALREEDDSAKPSPKPHPLSISFQPPTPTPAPEDDDDVLDEALRPPPEGDLGVDMSLELAGMGPDGEAFEAAGDLSQLQETDALLGGSLMDESMEDPFAVPPS